MLLGMCVKAGVEEERGDYNQTHSSILSDVVFVRLISCHPCDFNLSISDYFSHLVHYTRTDGNFLYVSCEATSVKTADEGKSCNMSRQSSCDHFTTLPSLN